MVEQWLIGSEGSVSDEGAPGGEAFIGFAHDPVTNVALTALGGGIHANGVKGDGARRGR